MSASPPKADICGATRDVRFGPIADIGLTEQFCWPTIMRRAFGFLTLIQFSRAEWCWPHGVLSNSGQEVQMRFVSKVIAALVLATALFHVDRTLAATNCGFLTIEQCRATVSGASFCVPNQFYNPQRSAQGSRKRGDTRAYQMPYDPYPWCAFYSDGGR